MAGLDAGTVRIGFAANFGGFVKDMNSLETRMAGFGRAFKNLSFSPAGITAASTLYTAISSAVSGMVNYFRETYRAIDATADMADSLGVTTGQLQGLQFAFSTFGMDASTAQRALMKMTDSIDQAQEEGSRAQKVFKRLGLSTSELMGKDALGQFKMIADAMGRVENNTERAGFALDIFGKNGVRMLSMLKEGADGVDKAMAHAALTGNQLSDAQSAMFQRNDKDLTIVSEAWEGLKTQAMLPLVEMLGAIAHNFDTLIIKTGVWKAMLEFQVTTLTAIARSMTYISMAWDYVGYGIERAKKGVQQFYSYLSDSDEIYQRRMKDDAADLESSWNDMKKRHKEMFDEQAERSRRAADAQVRDAERVKAARDPSYKSGTLTEIQSMLLPSAASMPSAGGSSRVIGRGLEEDQLTAQLDMAGSLRKIAATMGTGMPAVVAA